VRVVTPAIQIDVNGETREVAAGTTVASLIESLGLPLAAVAVERNGRVLPRAELAATTLEAGDRIEVVRFVQGGIPTI
jgi:thiamine biosynthesis protein ThiS